MDIIVLVALIAILFAVIGLCEPVAERLRLPFTVVLAAVGVIIGSGALLVLTSDLRRLVSPETFSALQVPIRSNVFLYVLLPTLLFQVALGINFRRMLDDWVPILLMAIVAVVVATVVIGFALVPFTTLPLVACLLIGAIVATTDPSAVVSIFRSIAAPQRLTRLLEGESLLNDAAAISLYGFFLTFVMWGVPDPTLNDVLVEFPRMILGGVAFGWIMARLAIPVLSHMDAFPHAQVSISIAVPYLTFVIAEQFLGASGVIAVVVAGLTINLIGPARMTPSNWNYLREVWGILSHWATSFIFVLAALLIPRLMADIQLYDLFLIMVVVLAAFVARALMLYGMLPLLSHYKLSPDVERPFRLAIMWGGLRGAVTLALALAVTESFQVPPTVQREVGIIATGFVLWTLLVQGTTLRWLIGRLGLDRLSPLDMALSNQVIAVALQNVREGVAETTKSHELNREVVRAEAKRFAERLENAVKRAESAEEIPDRDRITLGLIALGGRERDMILDAFRQQLVSARLIEHMLSDVDRLIERTRLGGRSEYLAAGRRTLGYGPWYRLAILLHNRLGLSGLLARLTSDRLEILLNQRLILRELHSYIDAKIRRIHGKRVAELLHESLRRREEETQKALDGLQLQYPGYVQEMERRFIRRTALRLEEYEYQVLHEDGLIGREVLTTLLHDLARERAQIEVQPTLDLAVQKAEFVRQFPMFAEMEEKQQLQLARSLKTIYAEPGDVLVRRGDVAREVFFIASGAVQVVTGGQKYRLGRGEFFGELGLLTKRRRRGHITAITHCTLLCLDEDRFRRLLERNEPLRSIVLETAERRGVKLKI